MARVCRESGARVARNVWVAKMNIEAQSWMENTDVIANGLPLRRSQLAVDRQAGWQASPAGRCQEAGAKREAKPKIYICATIFSVFGGLLRPHAKNVSVRSAVGILLALRATHD